jgi:alpha-glucosidase
MRAEGSVVRLLRVGLLVASLVAWSGCSSGTPPTKAELGGLKVRVDSSSARITISGPDGNPLFDGLIGGGVGDGRLPHVGFAFRRAEATYDMLGGSFQILEEEEQPWKGVTRFSRVRRVQNTLRFDLLSKKGEAVGAGVIEEAGPGEVTLTIGVYHDDANRVSAAFRCRPDEHFIGLGGQSFDVDHRGQTVPLWVQEDGIGKAETDDYGSDAWFVRGRRHSTHTPMPIFISSRGYALLLDTPYRSVFALCSEDEDVARVEAWEDVLRLRIFWGPTPAEAVTRLTAYLGRPELPPAFAFAPWLDAIYGSDNVRRVARKLRDESIPCSVIWTEDWRGGEHDGLGYTLEEDWHVDRDLYPDFELLASDLHGWGFKFLTYNNTFISKGSDVYEEAVERGFAIQTVNEKPYTFLNPKLETATMLDLTCPAARAWAKRIYREGLELGADGFMADYAEWLPVDAVLYSGEDALRLHNLYPVEYQRLNRELFDEMYAEDGVERLFFVRSAYLGSQPLVSVVWAGDQQTDFSLGDGLPSVIPMGIGLGVTGFPFFGHDISGYMSLQTEPATKELWFRWVSFGALSPVMRTHHGKSAEENWDWESDEESTAHMRRWADLHIRLFPYLYGLAAQAVETGLPMMRPLALSYPDYEPGWRLTDQYMLGDRIIVAPVVEPSVTSREVHLPEGVYYPLLGGDPVDVEGGGGAVEVDAPLTECPAFVPAGAMLVLLPEGVDTLVETSPDAGATSLGDVGDDRVIWVWPGGSSEWREAGGLTYSWSGEELAENPQQATFDGEVVPIEQGSVELTGNGTLTIDGSAVLDISGGDEQRSVVVRFRP